jgi:hypothetical protein
MIMANRRSNRWTDSRYWLVPLVLAGLIVWSKQITAGGFGGQENARCAMDGVFLHDLITHWPTGSIREWACQYYTKFPCLGLVVYNPPFFGVVEAAAFLIFGISATVARGVVVGFGLVGLISLYWVTRQLMDRDSAIAAAAIWAGSASTVVWSRQVALPVPAAAMMLLCCGCYLAFRGNRKNSWLGGACFFYVLAVLTCPWAMCIGPVLLMDLWLSVGFRKVMSFWNLLGGAIVAGLVSGYFLFRWLYVGAGSQITWPAMSSLRALPDGLIRQLGWLGLSFSVIGLLLLAAMGRARKIRLAILWITIFLVFASLVPQGDAGFFYLVTPAAAILIGGGFRCAVSGTQLRRPCEAIIAVMICWQFLVGWHADPGRMSDYRDAVAATAGEQGFQLVLFDGVRDGQFVFDMRCVQGYHGPCYVLRGSKMLYLEQPSGGYHEWVTSVPEIRRLLDEYAIRTVVVESQAPAVSGPQGRIPRPGVLLREVLHGGSQFQMLRRFRISDKGAWRDVELEIYLNRTAGKRRQYRIQVPVPAIGQSLDVALPPQ